MRNYDVVGFSSNPKDYDPVDVDLNQYFRDQDDLIVGRDEDQPYEEIKQRQVDFGENADCHDEEVDIPPVSEEKRAMLRIAKESLIRQSRLLHD